MPSARNISTPSPMTDLACWREVLALPGILVVVFDNCCYGAPVRHRQQLIANQAWLVVLSRDCPGPQVHRRAKIGFGEEVETKDLARYTPGLVARWAAALASYVEDPQQRCLPVLC